jgi:hypothetical protein
MYISWVRRLIYSKTGSKKSSKYDSNTALESCNGCVSDNKSSCALARERAGCISGSDRKFNYDVESLSVVWRNSPQPRNGVEESQVGFLMVNSTTTWC